MYRIVEFDRFFRINDLILAQKSRLSASFKQLQKNLVLQTIYA